MIQPADNFQSPIHFSAGNAPPLEWTRAAVRRDTKVAGALLGTVASVPSVRPEFVDRGRRLLADPDYPSRRVVRELVAIVSRKFGDSRDSA